MSRAGGVFKPGEKERGMSHPAEKEPLLVSTEHSSLQDGMINSGTRVGGGGSSGSKGVSNIGTFFNFAKASVGSGSFALPWGILQAGVLVGSAGMCLLGIASVYTMQLMLDIKRHIQKTMPSRDIKDLTYTRIGYIALGPLGKWAVNISVLGCNLGVCAGYMIFISTNLQWVFNCVSVRINEQVICFNTWEVYAILLPILILLTFLPSFKFLAYSAYLGTIFLVVAMIVVYVYGIQTGVFCAVDGIGGALKYVPDNWTGLAQWFGVTAFLFCVHSMVIPLESVMKRPSSMPAVLDSAALVVVGINLPFAVYGYLLFGTSTEGYVFSNLPGNWFNTVVRLFLSIELALTFPIVIKPATDVMEEIWKNTLMFFRRRFDVYSIETLYEGRSMGNTIARTAMIFALRTVLVLVSWSVAVGIPRFELCLALVGSLTTTVLAFVLPPLFYLRVLWKPTNLAKKIFLSVLLVVGIFVTVAATSINLYMAIESHSKPTTCQQFKDFCAKDYLDHYEHCYETIG